MIVSSAFGWRSAPAAMGPLSHHEEDHGWDLVEEFGYDLCGSFETSLSLATQKPGTDSPSRHHSLAKPNPNSQKLSHSIFGPHCYATVLSFEMAPNLTPQEVDEAREHNRMAARATSIAWAFGGVHKSDAHKKASSKPGDPVPHEYAEEDRIRLRADYLAWMFGGVHINNAHEDWDSLSPGEKEALRATFSKEQQQRSDEQVGRGKQ